MAGAGYKLFATGDVLTANQVNTFLMQQTTMVFASSAARTTALSGVVSEGMLTYLLDTNSLEYYDGAAFQPVSSPGDITGVTAGTGLSGGGTSGDVTLSINTAVTADLTTAQTLTNKTLTSPVLNLALNAQTATYTAVLGDASKLVTMDVATANDFLIPTNANVAFAIGTVINVSQIGVGETTIKAVTSGTTTINSNGAVATTPKTRAKFSAASCIKTDTDVWLVLGDIS
jgi:hypothetical protein